MERETIFLSQHIVTVLDYLEPHVYKTVMQMTLHYAFGMKTTAKIAECGSFEKALFELMKPIIDRDNGISED